MIPIRNIYYMLSYTFKSLKQNNYKDLGVEEFDNVDDLLAAILIKGTNLQLKRGLQKTYIMRNEDTSFPHGKINISSTIKRNLNISHKLNCDYDELSINNKFNQILKKSFIILLNRNTKKEYKKQIKKILYNFIDVDNIEVKNINYNLMFNRNNENYKLLIYICYLIIKSSIQDENNGIKKLPYIIDEQEMYLIYENFVREYYREEFKNLNIKRTHIKWFSDVNVNLPDMITDISIETENKIIIIDTKFYNSIISKYFGKTKYHSNNLYQIYSYVKNNQNITKKEVIGVLLYAKTDEENLTNNEYIIDNNKISIRLLDLNDKFEVIKNQLNSIIIDYV